MNRDEDRETTGATSAPEPAAVVAGLQADYLNAMIAGSGRQADQVVTRALDQQVMVNDVYLGILQTTAYEIGRLWKRNFTAWAAAWWPISWNRRAGPSTIWGRRYRYAILSALPAVSMPI